MPERLGFISNLRSRQPAIPTGRWIEPPDKHFVFLIPTLRCARRRPRYRAWVTATSRYTISPRGASTRKERIMCYIATPLPRFSYVVHAKSSEEYRKYSRDNGTRCVNAWHELYTSLQYRFTCIRVVVKSVAVACSKSRPNCQCRRTYAGRCQLGRRLYRLLEKREFHSPL